MSDVRFEMVKKRHGESLEKAIKTGKIDEAMVSLCTFIAGTKDFFTSSSCSGRILLLKMEKGESKRDASFHKKWHSPVQFQEFWKYLEKKNAQNLWFKTEPFILHIGCRNIEGARKILRIMKNAGIKRGGIIVAKEGKFIVEFQGTQEMAFPVKENGKMLVEKGFMEKMLSVANQKIEKNYKMLERLERTIRKELN